MPDFSRIINQAYMRILNRPADPGGLENYNQLLNGGMSESQMRETLIRSSEYAKKNPETTLATASRPATARKAKKKNLKKKVSGKKAAKRSGGSKAKRTKR